MFKFKFKFKFNFFFNLKFRTHFFKKSYLSHISYDWDSWLVTRGFATRDSCCDSLCYAWLVFWQPLTLVNRVVLTASRDGFFNPRIPRCRHCYSLSTDYTYSQLVNDSKRSEFSPRHLKFTFQRLIKSCFLATMHKSWRLALYSIHSISTV
jgi:hypothetical protein